MKLHSGRGLTQASENCFIHTDTANRPQFLVGVIFRQETGKRGEPPSCHTGFDTERTPFAKGHIMALELGGCDESFNIVPQYGQWQGCRGGAWREMEYALKTGGQEIMVVEMEYGTTVDTSVKAREKFHGGNNLTHWTSLNIPTRFRVWGLARSSVAVYLADVEEEKIADIAALIVSCHAEQPLLDARIAEMPEIDRRYWMDIMIKRAARKIYENYEKEVSKMAKEAAKAACAATQALNASGGGAIRRTSRSRDARIAGMPYARPAPELLSFSKWLGRDENLQEVADCIARNLDKMSEGWTCAERDALDRVSVARACFV